MLARGASSSRRDTELAASAADSLSDLDRANAVDVARRARVTSGRGQATGAAGMASSSAGVRSSAGRGAGGGATGSGGPAASSAAGRRGIRPQVAGLDDSRLFRELLNQSQFTPAEGGEVVEGLPPDIVDAICAQPAEGLRCSQSLRARARRLVLRLARVA